MQSLDIHYITIKPLLLVPSWDSLGILKALQKGVRPSRGNRRALPALALLSFEIQVSKVTLQWENYNILSWGHCVG